MKIGIKSRIYVKKCSRLKQAEKNDINKAANRVLTNPDDNSFKRDYLTPYRQEHPTNKQLTIFFEKISNSEKVFFVWINDNSCLHDTRKSHGEDPCLIEFKKLQQSGQLEQYSFDYHEGKLEITPRESDPHFFRFSAIDIDTYSNILNDGDSFYCMSLTSTDIKGDNIDDLFVHHLYLFLKVMRKHFKDNKQKLEFRIPPYFNEDVIEHLKAVLDPLEWEAGEEADYFLLKLL